MANRLARLLLGACLLVQSVVLANPSYPTGLVPRTWNGKKYGCKCYFGDACWPGSASWNTLNTTVGGRLSVYVPPEAACHKYFNGTLGTIPSYDAAKCEAVTANYTSEQWQ